MSDFVVPDWPRAQGLPRCSAIIRKRPEDFLVEERLGFEPEGEGEHCWLQVEKTGLNTAELVQRIARLAGVRRLDVGYAGLKDRNAVTRQWFSVHLPGQPDPDWAPLESEQVRILETARHMALSLLNEDPNLTRPENKNTRIHLHEIKLKNQNWGRIS